MDFRAFVACTQVHRVEGPEPYMSRKITLFIAKYTYACGTFDVMGFVPSWGECKGRLAQH